MSIFLSHSIICSESSSVLTAYQRVGYHFKEAMKKLLTGELGSRSSVQRLKCKLIYYILLIRTFQILGIICFV